VSRQILAGDINSGKKSDMSGRFTGDTALCRNAMVSYRKILTSRHRIDTAGVKWVASQKPPYGQVSTPEETVSGDGQICIF
jgi:hypothetical protein